MVGYRVTVRVVLTPRLYRDVNRDRLMTVHWIEYAQLLTTTKSIKRHADRLS